jgi:hypothetical protein
MHGLSWVWFFFLHPLLVPMSRNAWPVLTVNGIAENRPPRIHIERNTMEIQSTRLDAGNPFARQQQLASSVRHALNRLPPKTRAQVLAQFAPPLQPPRPVPQSAVSYRVPVTQVAAAPVQPVYPTIVSRPRRVAQPVPWQLALLINGIRLTRRAKKVWVREMNDAKKEWRWLQRQLLRPLAGRMVLFAPLAGKRRVLPAHRAIRGATAQRFAKR